MKIHTCLALLMTLAGTSSALSFVPRRTVQFAVLNLPGSSYLQMEVGGYYGGYAPRIDSMKLAFSGAIDLNTGLVRSVANLHVWSSVVATGDTGIDSHLVLITQAIPDTAEWKGSSPRRGTALRIDTVVHHEAGWAEPAFAVRIPHVDNSNVGPRLVSDVVSICLHEEPDERKARLVKEFADLWAKKPTHVELDPVTVATLIYVSPWARTNGTEDLSGIVAPLPGNRGNWIDVQTQSFTAMPMLPFAPKPAAAPAPTVIAPAKFHDLPTGFVRYIYNRTNNPDTKILELDGPRRIDGVYKVGPTLDVSGSTRDLTNGSVPSVDTLMGASSWLVLADSSDTRSLERAMWPQAGFCQGRQRTSAWKIDGTKIWLDQVTSIERDELIAPLATSAVSPRNLSGANPLLGIQSHPDGLELQLSQEATVRVVTLTGRVLKGSLHLSAGRHVVDLGEANGMLVVQASVEGRTESRTLLR